MEYWKTGIMGKKTLSPSHPSFQYSNIPASQFVRVRGFPPKILLDERLKKAVWKTAFGGVLEWSR
jgi:hypothetical protein